MLSLQAKQLELMTHSAFISKLETKLCRQIPEFSAQDELQRASFLVTTFKAGQTLGPVSELGCGSKLGGRSNATTT